MPEIVLDGCKPDGIMHALKALGVFCVIVEQKDPSARAWWNNNRFFTLDTKLSEADLIDFFCTEYKPIPLVSPWNQSSDFYKNGGLVSKIEQSSDARLEPYRQVIRVAREVVRDVLGSVYEEMFLRDTKSKKEKVEIEKKFKNKKETMILELRNKLPVPHSITTCLRPRSILSWLDTAWVGKSAGSMTPGPILLTGGNDGNFEMSVNFMETVLGHVVGGSTKKESELVRNTLFGTNSNVKFEEKNVGTYMPGAYMSPAVNSVGNAKYTFCNPWDYILAMEGIVFFAGSIYRRGEYKFASYPFSLKLSHGGYGTAAKDDGNKSNKKMNYENEKGKAEIWFPIWNSSATYDEIAYVFAEGRVQSSAKKPTTGADFAAALASFGAMRGISAFQRFGIFERKGQACHMTNIGNIHITENVGDGADLQEIRWAEVDAWLDRIRVKHDPSKKHTLPRSMNTLLRMIDDKMIRYCMHKKPTHLLDVLVLIGRIERQLTMSPRLDVCPLAGLSADWLNKCGCDTPEFRLAAALGSIYSNDNDSFYPIRYILEPVEMINTKLVWKSKNLPISWGHGSLIQNMISVLERWCYGVGRQPTIKSNIYARIDDVIKFIEGRVNDNMIYDLTLPLSMIKTNNNIKKLNGTCLNYNAVPEPYICLKSNFPPVLPLHDTGRTAVFESSIISLLKAGRQGEALDTMRRRLNISGYNVATYGNSSKMDEQGRASALRMCAALFFPVDPRDMKKLLEVIRTRTVTVNEKVAVP